MLECGTGVVPLGGWFTSPGREVVPMVALATVIIGLLKLIVDIVDLWLKFRQKATPKPPN